LPTLTTLLHGTPFVFWDAAQYYEHGVKLSDFALKKLEGGRTNAGAANRHVLELGWLGIGRAGTGRE